MRSSIFVSSVAATLLVAASAAAQHDDFLPSLTPRSRSANYALPAGAEFDTNCTYDGSSARYSRRAPTQSKRQATPASYQCESCNGAGCPSCDQNYCAHSHKRHAACGECYVCDSYGNDYCDSCADGGNYPTGHQGYGPYGNDCDCYGGHHHHKHHGHWLSDLFCCCDHHGCRPRWTVKAGAVIMERTQPQPVALISDDVTGEALLDARDFSFDWAGGPDISVIHSLGCCHAFEARYFGINDWTAERIFSPLSGVVDIIMSPAPIIEPATSVNASYSSKLYSGEANLRHRANKRVVWLWGFRYLELDESLRYALEDITGNSEFQFQTVNRLYGGQIGADIRLYDHGGPFYFDGVLKAGVFGNDSNNNYSGADPLGSEASADRQNQVAFVGEAGLTGVYQCTCHISLRGGYQCLWAEGVAVASDQQAAIDRATLTGINSRGGVFYHGALASIDLIW